METLEHPLRYFQEKRNFIRMPVEIPVKYRNIQNEKMGSGMTENLSASGLSFSTQDPPSAGDQLEIWISSFGNQIQPLKAKMRVHRVTTDPEKGFRITGSLENVE